eukprot:5323305-Pyramimonas_sp.AAC.3
MQSSLYLSSFISCRNASVTVLVCSTCSTPGSNGSWQKSTGAVRQAPGCRKTVHACNQWYNNATAFGRRLSLAAAGSRGQAFRNSESIVGRNVDFCLIK